MRFGGGFRNHMIFPGGMILADDGEVKLARRLCMKCNNAKSIAATNTEILHKVQQNQGWF